MWKLDKPTHDVVTIFKNCVNGKRDENLKNNFLTCTDYVKNSTIELESKFLNNNIHNVNPLHSVYEHVPKDEWKKLYEGRFVQKGSPGREYYDKLLAIPNHGICPLCAQRVVSTLDHYLPKSIFPTLVVSPLNLVAACKDCNTTKGDILITEMKNATIHPYFDNVDTDIWLHADLIQDSELSFKFYVVHPDSWDELLYLRVKHHFKVYKLNSLYTSHASSEFVSLKRRLLILYQKKGITAVKQHLNDAIEDCEYVSLNSWRVAMFRALYENEWFYDVWLKEQSSTF